MSIGAMVGPEAFMEVRYLGHVTQMQALDVIPDISRAFRESFGRDSGGLVRSYRTEDAETIVVALGSVLGTVKDTVDELRAEGHRIGALGITTFRPWPAQRGAPRAVPARGGSSSSRRRSRSGSVGSSRSTSASPPHPNDQTVHTVIAGLGGRPITTPSLRRVLTRCDAVGACPS